MEDGEAGGRRAEEDVKKEEALVRGSEEEPTKETQPASHFKPAEISNFGSVLTHCARFVSPHSNIECSAVTPLRPPLRPRGRGETG